MSKTFEQGEAPPAGGVWTSWASARWGRLAALAAVAVVATGCDQHTKARAIDALSDLPGHAVTVVDPWVRFSLTFNRGTAFSLIRDAGDLGWIFGLLALLVALLAGAWLWREGGWGRCLGAGLIAGGALGNGYDRLVREGVVDFIAITLPGGYQWPTFNIADAALVVGAAILVLIASADRPADATGPAAPEAGAPT